MGDPRCRRATAADLGAIVAMPADDVLGASRENASPAVGDCYRAAFAEIDADPNQFLCVVEDGEWFRELDRPQHEILENQGTFDRGSDLDLEFDLRPIHHTLTFNSDHPMGAARHTQGLQSLQRT